MNTWSLLQLWDKVHKMQAGLPKAPLHGTCVCCCCTRSTRAPSRPLSRSLLARCRLEGRFFDLIDCDSFGASTLVVGAALSAVRYGGLVCLTHTAGACCLSC